MDIITTYYTTTTTTTTYLILIISAPPAFANRSPVSAIIRRSSGSAALS
jgi:hypothetical protein